ncbi:MAG: hypothetical protein KatS3mg060_0770 [Dehalococcoidia bacterium]|nr:MAG: hypothetical protein KatS3mg060_0770 [Dehalococcoidia bacterium]
MSAPCVDEVRGEPVRGALCPRSSGEVELQGDPYGFIPVITMQSHAPPG